MIFVQAILVVVASVVFLAVIVMLSTGQLSVMSVAVERRLLLSLHRDRIRTSHIRASVNACLSAQALFS